MYFPRRGTWNRLQLLLWVSSARQFYSEVFTTSRRILKTSFSGFSLSSAHFFWSSPLESWIDLLLQGQWRDTFWEFPREGFGSISSWVKVGKTTPLLKTESVQYVQLGLFYWKFKTIIKKPRRLVAGNYETIYSKVELVVIRILVQDRKVCDCRRCW